MEELYTTISGDTWDMIAYKTTGDGRNMDLLIAENPQYADMFVFPAGVDIIIPAIEEKSSTTLPPWFE